MSERISEDLLAERWFEFMHSLIRGLRAAFRTANKAGITQKDIAAKLGKGPAFISRCLSGQQNMTVRTMHALALAMEHRLEIRLVPLAMLPQANNQPTQNSSLPSGTGGTHFIDLSRP